MAQALTLIDALAVIGGGIAGAHPVFLGALVQAMNATYATSVRRLAPRAFNLEDPADRDAFLRGEVRSLEVAGREILYDPMRRTAVGAYAFALRELDRQ
jgi:glucokinase